VQYLSGRRDIALLAIREKRDKKHIFSDFEIGSLGLIIKE